MTAPCIAGWPREPLPPLERIRINLANWSVFTYDEQLAIAEAWNAGLTVAVMSRQMHRSPTAVQTLVDNLRHLKVPMREATEADRMQTEQARKAADVARLTRWREANRKHAKRSTTEEKRLRRLAEFDPLARHLLEMGQAA